MSKRLTDAEYEKLSDDFAADPANFEFGEVYGPPDIHEQIAADAKKTATLTLRLPAALRVQVDQLADSDHVKAAEVVRTAVMAYVAQRTAAESYGPKRVSPDMVRFVTYRVLHSPDQPAAFVSAVDGLIQLGYDPASIDEQFADLRARTAELLKASARANDVLRHAGLRVGLVDEDHPPASA